MDSRISTTGITGVALFFIAYAQTTPVFSLFGVKPDIALAFAVVLAFSHTRFYECAFLAVCGALGMAHGMGLWQAGLFFAAIFVLTRGVRLALPWQPLLSGIALTTFFSFLTYVSPDWHLFARLAPQFAREACLNAAVFATLYALMPHRYAEQRGRY